MRVLWCLFLLHIILSQSDAATTSNLRKDEEILFFPSLGSLSPAGDEWLLDVQGCVYEVEERRFTLAAIEKLLNWRDVELSSAELDMLRRRARLFLVDHQRGRRVVVTVAGRIYEMPETRGDGIFSERIRVPASRLGTNAPATLEVTALLPAKDTRQFRGRIMLWGTSGLSVISDIDDTIKVTGIGSSSSVLRSTLLDEFRAVDGMVERFRALKNQQAQFCYLSASPWQLYSPLSDFVRTSGFPEGVFFLKQVRLQDKSRYNIWTAAANYKLPMIRQMMERFPNREFILVGDASEQDPEIFGTIAREYPRQIQRIIVRAPNELENERSGAAFSSVPADKVEVIR